MRAGHSCYIGKGVERCEISQLQRLLIHGTVAVCQRLVAGDGWHAWQVSMADAQGMIQHIKTPAVILAGTIKRLGSYQHQRQQVQEAFWTIHISVLAMQPISLLDMLQSSFLDSNKAHLDHFLLVPPPPCIPMPQ